MSSFVLRKILEKYFFAIYYNNSIILVLFYNNYTNIMQFTSTTELARKGSKTFKEIEYATVLHNNKDIGMVIGWDLYKKIQQNPYVFESCIRNLQEKI